jgi:hypothetical protein
MCRYTCGDSVTRCNVQVTFAVVGVTNMHVCYEILQQASHNL